MEYLLDVLMPTYNHERFIEEALIGVVSQKTNFRFRLLVAEDFSTDGTRDIIEKYQLAYPEIVFPFFRGKNLGAFENSRLLFKEMKSKYIALCEGDDFWTDRNKLQKQVDFLEAHPNYAGCFHNSEERYEDEDKASFLYCNYPAARNISFCDLSFANVIPSCSMMYRNGLFKFPGWFHELKMGDWPLNLLNARSGDFWFMPVVMAVHRLHKKSIWMLQDADKNRQATIEAYDEMIKEFTSDPKLSECLKQGKEAFVNSGKRVVSNGFKGKAKDVIIRMIEKL